MANRKRMLVVGARGITSHEGGVEKFAEEFCKRAAEVLDVEVTCLKPEVPANTSLMVHATGTVWFGKTDKILYYIKAAWLCLTRRYDYVFLLGINSAVLGLLTKLNLRQRPFVAVRSGSVDYILPKWGRLAKGYFRISERSMRFADYVIAVSPSIQRHLRTKSIGSALVRNGITISDRDATVRREGVIAVGRVTSQKNYSVLVRAAEKLPSVDFEIIGGPDKTDEFGHLSSSILASNLSNVRLSGAQDRQDVYARMNSAAIFVNCSIHEGMSNSALEAIQHGVPILLSDIDANRDLQLPDHHYFPPGDDTKLAQMLEVALAHPQEYIADVRRFCDWDEVVSKILSRIGAVNAGSGNEVVSGVAVPVLEA